MTFIFSQLLLALAVIGTLASTVFLVMALIGARKHLRTVHQLKTASAGILPPVSVLKPVHGMEPRLKENLESFFLQEYSGEWELLFCARYEDDAALQLVRQLSAQYPNVACRILTSGEPPWPNAKVYSLDKMVREAKHDILVISDSDVYVSKTYLRDVAPPLTDPQSGVITCLYRGLPISGIWARLEALGMSVEMNSGVLIANMLEGMKFALGPTMATRKDVIEKIGGVAQFGDYCADDYVIGNLADAAGYKNSISPHVIDHVVLNRTWTNSWAHQVRWMKSTRYSRPKGHFGTGLTFAVPFGILGLVGGLLAGYPALGWSLLAWSFVNRIIQSIAIGYGVVSDPRALRFCWLYPARDLLGFFLWIASYGSNLIDWRGEKYRLEFGGKMKKV